jgi:hypothetical protein
MSLQDPRQPALPVPAASGPWLAELRAEKVRLDEGPPERMFLAPSMHASGQFLHAGNVDLTLPGRNRVRRSVGSGITETETATASCSRKERRPRGESRRRRRSCCMRRTNSRLRFQPSRPAPSLHHQAPASAQRIQASHGVKTR